MDLDSELSPSTEDAEELKDDSGKKRASFKDGGDGAGKNPLLAAIRREVEAAEGRLKTRIQKGEQVYKQALADSVSQIEQRLAELEKHTPDLERRLAQNGETLRLSQDNHAALEQRLNQLDTRLSEALRQDEEAWRARMVEIEKDLDSLKATGQGSTPTAPAGDGEGDAVSKLEAVFIDLDDKVRGLEEWQETWRPQLSGLEQLVQDVAKKTDAAAVLQAEGDAAFSKYAELEGRLDQLSDKINAADEASLHMRLEQTEHSVEKVEALQAALLDLSGRLNSVEEQGQEAWRARIAELESEMQDLVVRAATAMPQANGSGETTDRCMALERAVEDLSTRLQTAEDLGQDAWRLRIQELEKEMQEAARRQSGLDGENDATADDEEDDAYRALEDKVLAMEATLTSLGTRIEVAEDKLALQAPGSAGELEASDTVVERWSAEAKEHGAAWLAARLQVTAEEADFWMRHRAILSQQENFENPDAQQEEEPAEVLSSERWTAVSGQNPGAWLAACLAKTGKQTAEEVLERWTTEGRDRGAGWLADQLRTSEEEAARWLAARCSSATAPAEASGRPDADVGPQLDAAAEAKDAALRSNCWTSASAWNGADWLAARFAAVERGGVDLEVPERIFVRFTSHGREHWDSTSREHGGAWLAASLSASKDDTAEQVLRRWKVDGHAKGAAWLATQLHTTEQEAATWLATHAVEHADDEDELFQVHSWDASARMHGGEWLALRFQAMEKSGKELSVPEKRLLKATEGLQHWTAGSRQNGGEWLLERLDPAAAALQAKVAAEAVGPATAGTSNTDSTAADAADLTTTASADLISAIGGSRLTPRGDPPSRAQADGRHVEGWMHALGEKQSGCAELAAAGGSRMGLQSPRRPETAAASSAPSPDAAAAGMQPAPAGHGQEPAPRPSALEGARHAAPLAAGSDDKAEEALTMALGALKGVGALKSEVQEVTRQLSAQASVLEELRQGILKDGSSQEIAELAVKAALERGMLDGTVTNAVQDSMKVATVYQPDETRSLEEEVRMLSTCIAAGEFALRTLAPHMAPRSRAAAARPAS
eukprot:TRINITY_DN3144_c0_g1_i1.p1 TRINITY_DN3144_c0_g1~~TRINITY_DN3144_c0_g1_i1.p1  ORF type:complete len:1060 (+),score=313.01 TRINITY_DN3144_c0_g1_i1:63-3242(+)